MVCKLIDLKLLMARKEMLKSVEVMLERFGTLLSIAGRLQTHTERTIQLRTHHAALMCCVQQMHALEHVHDEFQRELFNKITVANLVAAES
jgi:hypothetical protein